MANMLIDDRKAYPNLWNWVCTGLVEVFREAKTLEAFKQHSALTEPEARLAVERTDTPPWVHVRILPPDDGMEADARFRPSEPGRIMLAVEVAEAFELRPHDPAARRFVEAKVLHEMVHWGLCKQRIAEVNDVGIAFELEVYGKVEQRFWTAAPVRRYQFPVEGTVGSGLSYWGRNIRENNSRNHNGVDIHAARHRPVYAIADGTVVSVGGRYRRGGEYLTQVGNYGQMIDIDHGNGLVSRYAHLETVEVGPGPVKMGTRVGSVGASGTKLGAWLYGGEQGPPPANATPCHLHFEILKAGGVAFKDFDSTLDPGTLFEWLGKGAAARGVKTTALREGVAVGALVATSPTPPSVPPTSRGGGGGHDFPGDVPADAPRGLRNNNPGNIKIDPANRSDPWAGQLPPERETDSVFLLFSEMKFGIRAIARCLRTYQVRHQVRTLEAMSRRWAPSVDNNRPGEYAEIVRQNCRGVAQSVLETLDFTAADLVFGIIRGIIVAENGHEWAATISDEVVREGIQLERA